MRKLISITIICCTLLAAALLVFSTAAGEEMYPGLTWCDPLDPANAVPYPGVESKFLGWTCPQPTLGADDVPEPTPTAARMEITRPGRSR